MKERGAVWDAIPELYFKAFLLREAGRFGAIATTSPHFNLWRHDKAFRDWLMRGGYKIATDVIGRAEIETFFALDAFREEAGLAGFAPTQHHPPLRPPLHTTLQNDWYGRASQEEAYAYASHIQTD